jgi:rsbT co-antagonist protein RsbR
MLQASEARRTDDTRPLEPGAAPREVTELQYKAVIDHLPQRIFVKDVHSVYLMCNANLAKDYKIRPEEIVGQTDFAFNPAELAEQYRADDQRIMAQGQAETIEERYAGAGQDNWIRIVKAPLRDEAGSVVGVVGIFEDITERKLAEEKIRQQAQEILEMASVPVVQVWQGIVLVPLIGTLDSLRAQQLMERLLEYVAASGSPVAVIDITGVPTIDTQTAQHLIETISAVRLLGATVVLTGVRPSIAQTLVHLGIDLSSVATRSSLAAGLRTAMELLNLKVVDAKER